MMVCEIVEYLFGMLIFIGCFWLLVDVCLLVLILVSKVVCVGKNYVDYIVEMGGWLLVDLVIFFKFNIVIIGLNMLI